jgi:hypothetical protein
VSLSWAGNNLLIFRTNYRCHRMPQNRPNLWQKGRRWTYWVANVNEGQLLTTSRIDRKGSCFCYFRYLNWMAISWLYILKIGLKDKILVVNIHKDKNQLLHVTMEQHITRHQCRKTAVLSCHRFLFNSSVEKMNTI